MSSGASETTALSISLPAGAVTRSRNGAWSDGILTVCRPPSIALSLWCSFGKTHEALPVALT